MLNKKTSPQTGSKTGSFKKIALSSAACVLLAACQTTGQGVGNTSTPPASNATGIDAAIERATLNAAKKSGKTGSLSYLEKTYKRKSDNPKIATDYARALRENDYLSRAELVLAPFANSDESPADAKSEYAAIQLAQGNYTVAERYAQKAILQDNEHYEGYHHLGIALDAQGSHKEAERAFRKGLDHWQGDPTTIMNNLALNLASQNYLEEAVEILRKAQSVSPERREIERNLRIVTALQQSTGIRAPKPSPKPKAN